MARKISKILTEVELRFMQVIWRNEEADAEDVQNALFEKGYNLSGGSVRKVLSILLEKGYLDRRKEGKKYIYYPRVKQHQAKKSMLSDLLNRAFAGSPSDMFAALVDIDGLSANDIDAIHRMIETHKKKKQERIS